MILFYPMVFLFRFALITILLHLNQSPLFYFFSFPKEHLELSIWKLEYKQSWALKKWCFWTVVLEKTLESPWDCKEIKTVHPKGNQSWIFIGRTDAEAEAPILWPTDAKNWLIWKDPEAGKRLKVGEEGDGRGWDSWMASLTQWT